MTASTSIKAQPKEVWIGWLSSAAEAYNMSIYSFIAPLLATKLFQGTSNWNAVFFSYSLVLIGSCFLYPAGAIYYGLIGDKQGRQKTCIYSTLGLAIATGLMGFAPLYMLEGFAWIWFLILICAQHFFSGGEYHGSIVFSLEHSEHNQRGLMSSLSCLFAVFGLVAANGFASLSFVMDEEYWIRICFFIGGASGLISYLLKNFCRETPAFIAIRQESLQEMRVLEFIKSDWATIATVVSILAFFIVSYTFIFIFLPLMPFDTSTTHHFDTFKSLILYGILLVTAGFAADFAGLRNMLLAGLSLFSLAIIPLCALSTNLLTTQLILTLCACLVIGPIHSWMLQQFAIEKRCRGIFISAAIATSLFGGSTVPICVMIFEWTGSLAACAIYPLIIALVSFIILLSNGTSKLQYCS